MKIEIDRHILSEIIDNDQQLQKKNIRIDKLYNQVKALIERNRALYLHLVGEVKLSKKE